MADKKALVDSGATDNFMHPAFAKRMGLGLQKLPTPKKIFNIDNTSNKSGMITHFLDLNVQTNKINKEMRFLVTDIGHEDLLLGYPWLATFEPKFNWKSAVIDERILPITISSINPRIIKQQPIIAAGLIRGYKTKHRPTVGNRMPHSISGYRLSNRSWCRIKGSTTPRRIQRIYPSF
jgi:hypothetical protein